ncbi:T9SS type A sorting domain-containing protein [Dysgonomonas termitidis]|uniref:T9SS type A sorting domain-containing protein n=1 Tax=Dysgonomonas termitidis TaxID=1516126 RepID=A0ABV9L4V8_9BACT
MKVKTLTLLMSAGFVLPVCGQLNSLHNHLRPGDVLIKQQVEYVDPGGSGGNKTWDFSKLRTINDEYTLTYELPPLEGDSVYIVGTKRYEKNKVSDNELIVGTEHNTMYYYRLINDSLLQQGHENPSVKLAYTSPMVLMRFPLNYGQAVSSAYKSEGLYSGTVNIRTQGTMITKADAYGKMILPSGDTLSPVLRVKTIQTIFDIPDEDSYTTEENTNIGKQLETCRWYSKGYRYPVFETIRNINLADSTEIFSTAFFFPPQDHLYLDTDPENQALLDELWKGTESDIVNKEVKVVTLEDIMVCKLYPNPVESMLNVEYELKEDARVSFELYSIEGLPVKKITAKSKTAGNYYENIDCSGLHPKNYVLRITANRVFVNEVVIKK